MGKLKITILPDLDLRVYDVIGELKPKTWAKELERLAEAPAQMNLLVDFTDGSMSGFTLDDLKAAFAKTKSSASRAGGCTVLVLPHEAEATLFCLYKAWVDRTADFPVVIELADNRDAGMALLRRLLAARESGDGEAS